MKFHNCLFFCLFLGCGSASHIQLTGLPDKGKIVLDSQSEGLECEEKSFTQWSAFFNILPITGPTQEEMFPDPNKTYRFFEKWTAKDIVLSIPLAYISTVTRRSIVVESCEVGKVYALSEKELNEKIEERLSESEENVDKYLDELSEKARKGIKGNIKTRIFLHSGGKVEGELLIPKQKTDYVEINALIQRREKVQIKKKNIKDMENFK